MSEEIRYSVPFFQVPNELIDDPRTTVYHIALFCTLAMHANRERRAWPSLKRLASLTGASRPKVSTTIRELEEWGWLVVTRRKDEDCRTNKSNLYELQPSLHPSKPGYLPLGNHVTYPSKPGYHEPDPSEPDSIEPEQNARAMEKHLTQDPDPVLMAYREEIEALGLPTLSWPNTHKQHTALKDITAKTRALAPDSALPDPVEFARGILAVFKRRKETGKGTYWKDASPEPVVLQRRFGELVIGLGDEFTRVQDEQAGMDALRRMGKI